METRLQSIAELTSRTYARTKARAELAAGLQVPPAPVAANRNAAKARGSSGETPDEIINRILSVQLPMHPDIPRPRPSAPHEIVTSSPLGGGGWASVEPAMEPAAVLYTPHDAHPRCRVPGPPRRF